MSDELKKLEGIRKKLEAAQKERDKLVGKSEAALDELKKLGYKSVAEANAALVKLGKEADKADKAFRDAFDAFVDKYPDLAE